jgi:hypothetical protein
MPSISPEMPRRERAIPELHTRPWSNTSTRLRQRGALPGAHVSSRRGRVIAARDYEGRDGER